MDKQTHDHYLSLIDRWQRDADHYKALLFDAWKSLRGQQKGLNRQARKIKRLQRELRIAQCPLHECCGKPEAKECLFYSSPNDSSNFVNAK